MNTTWSKPTKYLVAVGLVLFGIFILGLSDEMIPSLIVAALIAMIVRPVVLLLERRVRLPHGPAVGLVYLGLAILVPMIVVLSLPTIIDTLAYLGNLDYASILRSLGEWLRSSLIAIKSGQLPVAGLDAYVDRAIDTLLEAFQPIPPSAATPPSLEASLRQLSSVLLSVVGAGANLAGVVISQAAKLIFTFLASIYISLDGPNYRGALLAAAQEAYQSEFSYLLDRIERVWNAYFQGELKLMLIIGVATTIGGTVIGLPGALYLGIIAGLFEFIPNLGPFLAAIPAVIVALVQGSTYLPINHLYFALLVILFYILVQQVENNLIVPRVLGNALEMPPLVVITGVVVGASVGGILGALLATPVIATGREVLDYIHDKMLDREPIRVESASPEPSISPSGNRLSSLVAGFQRRIRTRSPESRQGSGEPSHPQNKPGHGGPS